jgi:hypothetical protein
MSPPKSRYIYPNVFSVVVADIPVTYSNSVSGFKNNIKIYTCAAATAAP